MKKISQLADNGTTIDDEYTSFTVNIMTGVQVLNAISDNSFLTKWDKLYQACPWGTVFQSQEFVGAWYRYYHSEFLPVIVKAEANGILLGLLTLTIEAEKRLIMAAGLGAAEYQTWLALPSFSETFITKTLQKLQASFSRFDINLYNAPPNTPLEWAISDRYWQKRCLIKSLRRPLMDLRDPEVSKIFRKKQFREKTNRLRRLGNLSFEKVSEVTHFDSILNELAAQSDFRKGAKFNHSEFTNGTARRQFLLELFEQGILHTTILKLDEQIIASIAACTGRGSVHLAGINTYSPTLSRFSPGTINFVMLGQLLMEEGMEIFDLTPGGDAYKERLATSYDYVHDVYISRKFKTLFVQKIVWPFADLIKSHLTNHGITPRMLKVELVKIRQRVALAIITNPSNLFSWNYLRKGHSKHQEIIEFNFQQNEVKASLKVNSLQDLLQYDQQNSFVIRWDFLDDAMRRFEKGDNVYTLTDDDVLIFCAWHSTQESNHLPISPISTEALFLDGIYCHPKIMHRLKGLLMHTAKEVQPEPKTIYCLINKQYMGLLA